MKFTLGADKRLKSQKKIERLFLSGKSTKAFPLKSVYYFEPNEKPGFKIAVSVPKKLFKKAVHRNLLKRRIREAFRLHQHHLNLSSKLEVMFIYTTNEIHDFTRIEKAMLNLIDVLNSISNDSISEK
ncbi:ribonuclease P protein component [Moheibacter lacus]|uniref:Ribonuclease P protein component n=1 Tax=Moheibacter lacus TaxID=2745851 RepID=A0A838ZN05_9FLAO|nr:ribonuclease P protein component [Moheibacter lacus]MBA5629006.1 ribonuclease P protein component [Moheibacter lacus]